MHDAKRILAQLSSAKRFLANRQPKEAIDLLAPYAKKHANQELLFTLGRAYGEMGRHGDAEEAFKRALALVPNSPTLHFALALSLQNQGQEYWREAASHYSKVPPQSPLGIEALTQLININLTLDNYADAALWARQLLVLAPDNAAFHLWAGMAYQGAGNYTSALAAYQAAEKLGIDDRYTLHLNLGTCHYSLGQLQQALDHFKQARLIRPDCQQTQLNIATAKLEMGDPGQAISDLAHLTLDRARITYLYALNFDPDYSASNCHAAHKAWGKHISTGTPAKPLQHVDRDPERPLNIGYVSSDFRNHAVMYFLMRTLESHDHTQFRIHCYSDSPLEDDWTQRIKAIPHLSWRYIYNQPDETVMEQARRDQIDILIDLGGHTGSRVTLFARRVAPLQVSYLGYPNTTGLETMDYRFTDELVDPPGMTDSFYTEKLVRLGRNFYTYTLPSTRIAAGPAPLLANKHLTFGSFNRASKLNPNVIALWARVLNTLPDAKLLMQARIFDSPQTGKELLAQFSRHGIEPDRIETRGYTDFERYLGTHQEIDVILDTFPWNGHTNTMHALWMGVPTLTLAGQHHAGRFGYGIMTLMELPEFIAHSHDEFIEKARFIAAQPEKLADIRTNLRHRLEVSSLCDAQRLTASIEENYRAMWRNWCEAHETTSGDA